jgi:tetratricopeptide (TPR) repeat protein
MTEREALAALRGDDPAAAADAEAALWRLWSHARRPEVDDLFARGVAMLQLRQLAEAEAVFDRIIALAPDFAEGWNKRATVRYVAGNYAGAIEDCEQTLARNPNHFGALSGQGLCHMALGRYREAADLFRRTIAVHPHLASARRNLATAVAEAVRGNGGG